MKTKIILTIFATFAATALASAATNDVAALLQRGLFEEEANHQLDAAIGDYKEAIERFDSERQLAATAIFRLGECYRKQGRTNEANAQYERIVREFPDQTQLAQLSRSYMPAGGGVAAALATGASALPSDEEQFLRKVKESMRNSPDLMNQQLGEAAAHGYVSAAEFLLAHGANANQSGPIIVAARNGNVAMLDLLLSHGSPVESREDNNSGRTALFWAVGRGFMTVCRTLVAHGANVNAKDNNGETPLFEAVRTENLSVAEFLITNKAQIDLKNVVGLTPLANAIGRGTVDMVKLLLNNYADPNMETAPPNGPSSPLVFAITHARPQAAETVQLLLDHGAKPNAVDAKGETALDYAIGHGNTDAVRELIAHGADVNILDKEGRPSLAHLHSPLSDTDRQIEALLIKAGADPDYDRRRGIWIAGSEGKPKTMIFSCPTNSINHYTLLDFLATLYALDGYLYHQNAGGYYPHYDAMTQFPDFARITIHRLTGKSASTLNVNVADFLRSGDGSKDVGLQAGDMVQIPEQQHKVADEWVALSLEDATALNKCLLRTVQVVAQGKTMVIALAPSLGIVSPSPFRPAHGGVTADLETNWLTEALHGRKADTVVRSFLLNSVVHDADVLLNTSDLSRVRLTRGGVKMTFDLTAKTPPKVWLEEGDVIEIPEIGESEGSGGK